MPFVTKSFFMRGFLAGSFLLALAACEDIENINMPHVFGGNEVPPAITAEPRLVKVPPPLDPATPWPRVGDVPRKPDNFTSRPLIDATFQQMENERANAIADKTQIEQQQPLQQPTTVQPPLGQIEEPALPASPFAAPSDAKLPSSTTFLSPPPSSEAPSSPSSPPPPSPSFLSSP